MHLNIGQTRTITLNFKQTAAIFNKVNVNITHKNSVEQVKTLNKSKNNITLAFNCVVVISLGNAPNTKLASSTGKPSENQNRNQNQLRTKNK